MNEFDKKYDPEKLREILEKTTYTSPITTLVGDISHELVKTREDTIVSVVRQALGYEIDRDELMRALSYDRDQYRRGYEAGVNSMVRELEVYSKALERASDDINKFCNTRGMIEECFSCPLSSYDCPLEAKDYIKLAREVLEND